MITIRKNNTTHFQNLYTTLIAWNIQSNRDIKLDVVDSGGRLTCVVTGVKNTAKLDTLQMSLRLLIFKRGNIVEVELMFVDDLVVVFCHKYN